MTSAKSVNLSGYTDAVIRELQHTLRQVSDESAGQLVERILQAQKVFVAGAGRSGLMMKAFAMRLMHLGLQVYVVGETVTPGLGRDDLLIIGSGSGETKSLAGMAAKARSLGASVASVTVNPKSTIGQLSETVIELRAAVKDSSNPEKTTIQPMGSLFEQSLLLVLDSIILSIMERKGTDGSTMFGQHANLE
ncbi:6-phospho-3-hexuloisomerase [Paenibacillus sp. TAB 01]|uniref:6-phospho-3-hexuloisomerase n=1 Tax=Paenibacillus sp. TAB 01 TaxID=3368988 RepID=UPI00375097BB